MSFWKKSMEYLGLGPDDAYDDYDDGADPEPQGVRHVRRATTAVVRASRAWPFVLAGRARVRLREGRAGAAELPVA